MDGHAKARPYNADAIRRIRLICCLILVGALVYDGVVEIDFS